MRDLLYLSHRIPYPPNKGDKIRSFKILEYLSRSYRIHLGCFVDDPEDLKHVDALNEICAQVCAVENLGLRRKLKAVPGLLTGRALSVSMFFSPAIKSWVEKVIAEVNPSSAFIYSSAMAQYLCQSGGTKLPYVIDFVDVDSDKWKQYSETAHFPLKWIYKREARTLLDYDRSVALNAASALFVSESEATLFQSLAPESARKTQAVRNGIDHVKFSPNQGWANPYSGKGPILVFTGSMDYWPNVDAVTWFATDIFSVIRRTFPTCQFYIVGARPTAQVQALAEIDGISVTGGVPEVQPYLHHAAAAVAPLRIARGIQNKVLEAMAMGLPTIVTKAALEGVNAKVGEEVLLAKHQDDFVKAVAKIIDNEFAAEMGTKARDRVVRDYSWDDQLFQLDDIMASVS